MKTLAQIEPRTPVGAETTPGGASSLYSITQPGAHYLTANVLGVTNRYGIAIDADNVTLDLNGFALIGVTNSRAGIIIMNTSSNICVRNGAIQGWGGAGMYMGSGYGCIYEGLRLSGNGAEGLRAGLVSVVKACTAIGNSGVGISASMGSVVTGCAMRNNAGHGLLASNSGVLVSECNSLENGGDGFHGATSVSYKHCFARGNDGHGFYADTGSSFLECQASVNGTNGIHARARSFVLHNDCSNNSAAGIAVDADASRIEANTVTGNTGPGIKVNGTVNLIIQNSARGNGGTGNYDIVSGNRVGIIVIPTVSGAITGNGPGFGLGTTDPWANFAF
ncbi:MAG TPA: right-handed parallel beta-helix repeat-containing protein [Verrucomicrobiae bacterium]